MELAAKVGADVRFELGGENGARGTQGHMSLAHGKPLRPGAMRPRAVIATPRVAASPEQRRKVARRSCLVCGRRPVDPAHLVPRRFGGCDWPDCVVPLCRTHHRLYDCGELALVPYLTPELERELRHAFVHVECAELEAGLTRGWPAPWQQGEPTDTTEGGRR